MIGLRALLLLAGMTLTASAHGQSVNLTESDDPALQNALQSLIDERTKAGASNTRASSEQLVRYLRSEGYYTARVIVDQSDDAPIYQVTAGERFYFTAVSVRAGGQSDARSVAREALSIEVGDPVRAEDVLNASLGLEPNKTRWQLDLERVQNRSNPRRLEDWKTYHLTSLK